MKIQIDEKYQIRTNGQMGWEIAKLTPRSRAGARTEEFTAILWPGSLRASVVALSRLYAADDGGTYDLAEALQRLEAIEDRITAQIDSSKLGRLAA